jgi:nucleoside-diphosphate-sugar epimerase
MNVLVTGGAGYIGSTLVPMLLEREDVDKVYVLDNLIFKQTSLFGYCHHDKLDFVYGDVRNYSLLKFYLDKADVVFPLAAIVGAAACDLDPQMTKDVNLGHVEFICRNFDKNKSLVFPQTNSGYGLGQGDEFCTEESPLNPISLYGKTKCEAEKSVLDFGGIALRLATVFGVSPRMRLDLLVNDFTYKALSDGYIVLFEKHFKRNYIHVRDVAHAFLFMMDNYGKCKNNVYNLGLSSANLSKYELAMRIKEYVPGFSIQCDDIRQDPDKRNYIVSNEKIEKAGWLPTKSLDDGIKELKKAYKMIFRSQQIHSNV